MFQVVAIWSATLLIVIVVGIQPQLLHRQMGYGYVPLNYLQKQAKSRGLQTPDLEQEQAL